VAKKKFYKIDTSRTKWRLMLMVWQRIGIDGAGKVRKYIFLFARL
jgi:hypothetical protein